LVLVLALVGLGFAGTSAWVHHRILSDPAYSSFCDVNQVFNCTQVYLSRFGTVWGVPVAVGGVLWFALVALVAGMNRPAAGGPDADATPAYLFVLATIGLAAILYLGYASFFVLGHYCLLCIGTYVSVIGIFIVTGAATTIPMRKVPGRFLRDLGGLRRRPAALVVAILFLVGAVALVEAFPKEPVMRQVLPMPASVPGAPAPAPPPPAAQTPPDRMTAFLQSWDSVPRVDVGVPADGAKVVIVKFNDYMCPMCKQMYYALKPVLERYQKTNPGAIKFVTKDYPLNKNCNASISQTVPGHVAPCEAAVAVRIARDLGKVDAMEQWLFENQATLTPTSVKYGVSRVLGVNDFDQQYAVKIAGVKQDVADGAALHISATPTFFVNGVTIPGQIPIDLFDAGIDHELKKAGAIR
jgi:uncharacterized membrane protein/protein-disulfide isomerase